MIAKVSRLVWFQVALGSIALFVAPIVYLLSLDSSDDDRRIGFQIYWMNHDIPYGETLPNGETDYDFAKMDAEFARVHPELIADPNPRAIAATCDFASGYIVVAYGIHGVGKLIRRRKRHT